MTSAMDVKDCNSQWAQGGIIYKGKQDSPELLGRDIHIAGAGRCKNQPSRSSPKKDRPQWRS